MKRILFFSLIIVVLALAVFVLTQWSQQKKIVNQQLVEKYIQQNISAISPEREVLGGRFYTTNISLYGNNEGVVDYEDGHIALRGHFQYRVKDQRVFIYDFKILK